MQLYSSDEERLCHSERNEAVQLIARGEPRPGAGHPSDTRGNRDIVGGRVQHAQLFPTDTGPISGLGEVAWQLVSDPARRFAGNNLACQNCHLQGGTQPYAQKPIDTPYGPYVDGFSLEQHKYGPFGPIRAKVEELAVASHTANAGEPDNGSGASERAK